MSADVAGALSPNLAGAAAPPGSVVFYYIFFYLLAFVGVRCAEDSDAQVSQSETWCAQHEPVQRVRVLRTKFRFFLYNDFKRLKIQNPLFIILFPGGRSKRMAHCILSTHSLLSSATVKRKKKKEKKKKSFALT